jgi:hypothetical protein
MTIGLGTCDANCAPTDAAQYFARLHETTMRREARFRGEGDGEWIGFRESPGNDVLDLQRFLKSAGFMPFGKLDGIFGYRTAASLRLFQEYVRSIEGDASIGAADGVLGPRTDEHIGRWRANTDRASWEAFSSGNPTPEYARWLGLIEKVRAHYLRRPTPLLERVNEFEGPSDSLGVADWNCDRTRIHLIGVRCGESAPGPRVNDDVFLLLINGVTFKFYGTTDPGKTSHDDGAPFLVPGQHRYRFGWHKLTDMKRVYRALKPASGGVLIVRDGDRDQALTDADLAGRLETNNSINVHWGGRGVSNWSEGCQVICGKGYIGHENEPIDCSRFAAARYAELGARVNGVYMTKGAYSVLVDLVTAFSSDVHAADYTLLYERDLELEPAIDRGVVATILAALA